MLTQEWLDPAHPPSAALAKCKVCRDVLVSLLQLNGELPERFPGHERRLYVFACRRKSCRRKEGSIRALRSVRCCPDAPPALANDKRGAPREDKRKPAATTGVAVSTGLGESLFGVKAPVGRPVQANPFSASAGTNPFSAAQDGDATPVKPSSAPMAEAQLSRTFAETLSLNSKPVSLGPPPPPEPWPEESAQPAAYPVSWLDAEREMLDPTPLPRMPSNASAMDVDADGRKGGGRGKEDKDVFESTMDSAFQKFADRVGQNPEQCIRYEFGGQPLLYSRTDAVGALLQQGGGQVGIITARKGMPPCQNCGANRVFEVQLMPQAIAELEQDEVDLDGMDWGTIIVGVCEKDCQERGVRPGESGHVEEWVGVQWEEIITRK